MKKNQSIDGFILRKDSDSNRIINGEMNKRRIYLDGGKLTVQLPSKQQRTDDAVDMASPVNRKIIEDALDPDNLNDQINDSLSELQDLNGQETAAGSDADNRVQSRRSTRRAGRKSDKRNKSPKKKRKWLKKLIISVILAGLLFFVGSVILRVMGGVSSMFEGNPLDALISTTPLKEDANGRTNILILGTADDEAGHDGGTLTDSIMIMSIDQDNYDAYMISIPRDLWVDYGQSCPAGYKGKINAAYSCYGGATNDVAKDKAALKKSITLFSGITGIDIQYAANVNYTVFRDVVNAIGGSITVNIQSRNSRGILDSTFDWKCGNTKAQRIKTCPPDGHFLQLSNGEQTLDAEHALYLALARGHSAPTYGLEQSNFDREKNQQLVIKGIIDKAKSNGSFTNISTVLTLIDSMGTNLRTTFDAGNVKTLAKISQNFNSDSMQSISLIDSDPALLKTGMISSQSVVMPVAGVFEYSDIQAYLKKQLSNDPAQSENPTVYVYNGGAANGAATTATEKLTDKGYDATTKGNLDSDMDVSYKIYDLTNGKKSRSSAAFAKLFGVSVEKISDKSKLPSGVGSDADFVIVVGTEYKSE